LFIAGEDDASRGVVMAAPHPAYGGSMESPVVSEVSHAARTAGLASLRFNWSGIGASGGLPSSDPEVAGVDYGAALEHLLETLPGVLVAAGYSFGAAAAARIGALEPRVRELVLVAPPPSLLDVDSLMEFPGPIRIVVGDSDAFAPVQELERIVAKLPRGDLKVIPATDHFFAVGLAELGRITGKWFANPGGRARSSGSGSEVV
jgi:alpha/beta superfamily hydrolase